jgi:transcriptional regulator with XRE-family HTH domain
MDEGFCLMPLTGDQLRAARALLRWSAADLAERAGVSLPTVQRLESAAGTAGARVSTVEALEKALEQAGVIFIPEGDEGAGVRLARSAKRLRTRPARRTAAR